MDKRKGIILAVIIFLLIGLGTFVFANESLNGGDETNKNPNGANDESLDTDGSGNGGEEEDTPDEDDSDEDESTPITIGGNNGSGNNNGSSNDNDSNSSTGNGNENNGDSGSSDPNEGTDDTDTSAPIITILDKSYQGLGNSIGYLATNVELVLAEENLEVTITQDGNPINFANGMTLSSDGVYKLTVTDASGNTTEVEFSIDKSAPVISGIKDGDITSTIGDITVEDANEVTILLNGEEVSISDIASKVVEGQNTLVVRDSLNNEESITFTYDTTPIAKEWLYTLNQTYHNTDLEDKHYQVIGDNQKLYVELTFTEEFETTPIITVGTSEAINMSCSWTNWETERQYYKCDATITIDGTSQELTNALELPISITNIVDAAGNETTLDNDDITDNGTYGQVIYDNEAPVYASLGVLNVTHLRENNAGSSEDLTVVNVGDEIRIILRFNEILAVNPTITIGGSAYELTLRTNYDNFAKYTYTADIKITEDMKLDNGNVDFEISGYADAAGNVGNVLTSSNINNNKYTGVELDTNAPVNTDIIFKNIDGNEQYAKAKDRVWLYLIFDERLAQDPTVTINGVSAKRIQYENGDNWDQDWEKYVFEYVVPEDVTEGAITFEVTNVIDKAGNQLEDTITNANTEDTVNADVTLPERGYSTLGFEYTASNDKGYEEIDGKKIYYVKEGDSFQYKIAFTEELQDGLIATIAGTPVELEFLTYNDANGYVYGGEYLVPAGLTEGEELEIIVSNIKDLAGNEYANKTITDVPTSNGRVAVYDDVNPEIIVKKWPANDNPTPLEKNGVYNYCVVAQASDSHLYSFKLDGIDYTENTTICNNGTHELTATDYAGNTETFKFEIDREYASVIINGTDEYKTHDTETIHVYQEITSIEFSESVTVRLTYNNNSNAEYFGSSAEFEYTFVDGLYKIELFDKGGNPTLVMIKVDGTAPQPAYLSFRVDGDATSGVDTYYATNGDRLYISFASNEKLGQEPIYILKDSKGKEFTYSRTEEVWVNNIGQYIYTSYVDVNSEVDFADGTITARVENIVDEAGNGYAKELKSSLNVKIDRTSPIAKRTYWSNEPIAWGSEFDATKLPIEYSDNISEIENLIVSEKYTFKAAGSTIYDDSITEINPKKAGLYYRYLTVTDEAGNVSETISIPYEVVDNEAPVITKKVESDIYVPVGTKLEIKDLVTATDNNDGDITDLVYLLNEHNTNEAGDYLFEFYVLDSSGNRGYTPLRVHVVSNEAYADSIIATINYAGNERKEVNILSSVTVDASLLNIPAGKIINGNGLLNVNGSLSINNSNITLNDVNIENSAQSIEIAQNVQNLVINGGNYTTTDVNLQGQGTIRGFGNNAVKISNATLRGGIYLANYSGSNDDIKDNNITLDYVGAAPLSGIVITTADENKYSALTIYDRNTFNIDSLNQPYSYYVMIQRLDWSNIQVVDLNGNLITF